MPIEYINRKNEKYYLKIALTKTGKKQWCAVKNIAKINQSELSEEIPLGHEFYESPMNAQVVLRKIPIYNVSDEEVAIIDSVMKKHETISDYIIDKGENDITIYTLRTDDNIDEDDDPYLKYKRMLYTRKYGRYDEGLKFKKNKKKSNKEYDVQRFCYRSSSYGWITIDSSDDLRYLAEKYCYHIDKESLYDFWGW